MEARTCITAAVFVVVVEKLPGGFPEITLPPSTKVVEIGHSAVLVCSAAGSPLPRITWVREMVPVDTANNQRYTVLESGRPGKQTSPLVFLLPTPEKTPL